MADDAQTSGLEFIKEEEPVHLPDDLLLLILSKLPLKSLKRFTCVCKFWALLFENPNFMKIFLNNFVSNWSHNNQDTSLLLSREYHIEGRFRTSLFSLSNGSIQSMVKLEWPNPFQEDDPNVYVMGSTSINGILCLYHRHGHIHSPANTVVLWNPTTQESKVVPPSPVDSVPPNQQGSFILIGFGYDRVRDDYKMIRYASFFLLPGPPGPPLQETLWEIYSLRSNSWRTLDFDDTGFPYCSDYISRLYLDGMCHWIGRTNDLQTILVSFDLSNEVFYTTCMPSDMPSSQYLYPVRHLLSLNESVAVITNPSETTDFYISILAEVGVKESWIKLFILKSLPCIIRPLGIGKKGNIFFIKDTDDFGKKKNIFFVKDTDDSELVQFDLSTYMIEELGVKGVKDWSQLILYKKSFLPIGETNN